MTGGEDTQYSAIKRLPRIGRRVGKFINQLARARLADATGTKIIPGNLSPVGLDKGSVNKRVNSLIGVLGGNPDSINKARLVIEIHEHHHLLKRHIAIERLALHGVLEAINAGFDDLIDVGGTAIMKRFHQTKLGQRLCKKPPGIDDGFLFHVGFIDHADIPFSNCRPGLEATHRTETVIGKTIPVQLVAMAEAPGLTSADGARCHPSKSRVRSSFPSGCSLIRCDANTMKRLMAFDAMASSSANLRFWMG